MRNIWRFFTSARLTVILTTLIAVDVLVGALLISFFPETLGDIDLEVFFYWLFGKGVDNLGLSWWIFLLLFLMGLLALNTVACTIESSVPLFRTRQRTRASKRRRLLSQAIHLGFVIGLVGHLISSASGFRAPDNRLFEGASLPLPQDPEWSIRLNKMDVAFSDRGRMEKMDAYLSLIKGDEVIRDKVVRLNEPLLHRGNAVYLVHHGKAPRGVRLEASGSDVSETLLLEFLDAGGTSFRDYRIVPARFVPDFAMDNAGKVYSASDTFSNPALKLEIYKGETPVKTGWVFLNFPDWMSLSFDGYRLVFSSLDYASYAVLTVNKDPGAVIVLSGALIFMIALIGMLFSKGEGVELVEGGKVVSSKA